eukprot:jgi/Ulvmu1/6778/UM030_0116.1
MRVPGIQVTAGFNTFHAKSVRLKASSLLGCNETRRPGIKRIAARSNAPTHVQPSTPPTHKRVKTGNDASRQTRPRARVNSSSPGHSRYHEREKSRRGRRSTPRKSNHKPVTLQQWLRQARHLEDCAPSQLPDRTLQCIQQLAAFPRGSIGPADIPATVQVVNNTLALAKTTRRKPRLLSDLGKALQAQRSLSLRLHHSPDFQRHLSTLFSLAAADPFSFSDPIDISQLATAQVKIGHYSAAYWAALERHGLRTLPSRQFANVVHAAAKLTANVAAPRPSAGLQQRVWHAAEAGGHRLMAEMSGAHISNLWWAFATLNLEVPPTTRDVLTAATARLALTMTPQSVSITLWAFATLRQPIDGLFVVLERAVVATAPHANPQNVGITMWAWATMRLPPARIQKPIAAAVVRNAASMSEQNVSNVLWAWGLLTLPPSDVVPVVLQRFAALADRGAVGSQSLANVWWALARLRVSDGAVAAQLDATLEENLRDHAACRAQHAVSVMSGCVTLTRLPPPPLLVGLIRALLQGSGGARGRTFSHALWALGVLAVLPGAGVSGAPPQGSAAAAQAGSLQAVFDEAVQRLAGELVRRYNSGSRFDFRSMRQIHAVSGVLALDGRFGQQAGQLLRACREAAAAEQEAGGAAAEGLRGDCIVSDLHRAVLGTLCGMPELAEFTITSEASVGDGTRRVDVLLEGHGAHVVLEVDGPSHYVTDAVGAVVCETGNTVLRNWQLRDWGYILVRAPVTNRSSSWLGGSEGAAWLLRLLRSAGAPI